jgi:beta-glucosidase
MSQHTAVRLFCTVTKMIQGCMLYASLSVIVLYAQTPDYLNTDLPIDARVDDLVSRMTLEEKVSQTLDQAPAIERLGVPEYNWWNEALHGVARAGLATSFPQAVGLAATWNDSLIFRMATAISDEARAKHHEFVRQGERRRYQGLTIWSPNINIFRDPRWGRGMETYGEDPFLTARLTVPFVRGLQGDHPDYLKTIATVKHYAVHSGPEPDRHHFDAVVSARDFRETYLPHFETGIREGGSYSLMCAYNRVYGDPACGSGFLMDDILRSEWEFDGFVVSDCWALDDFYLHHQVVESPVEAAAMGLQAGTDLDCGSEVYPYLVEAVERGLITEDEIDVAVKRLFTARFRLGMFDPPELVAYQRIPYDVVDSEPHRQLAREVTRESIVLLKNEGLLPLSKDLGTIAVVGPNADDALTLLGNYHGMPSNIVTPLQGIKNAVSENTRVVHAIGSDIAPDLPVFTVVPSEVLYHGDGLRGLRADYFDSHDLDAEPLFSDVDYGVDSYWGEGAPREDMDPDNFGVRWTGEIRPPRTGIYRFGVTTTMQFEFYIEDSLALRSAYHFRDELPDPRLREMREPVYLEAGKTYRIRIDARESYGDAQMHFLWAPSGIDLESEAVAAARNADAVILILGLTPRIEGEEMPVIIEGFHGGDRTSIDLPAPQQRLMERIVALGKPTVLVLVNGSALAVNWADAHVPAIVEAWYGGQAAGTALADVLFGDYNPAGRLPVTFYRSVDDLPPFEDYSMRGRTYRFFDGEVLYPFGHGLSYTSFEYEGLRLSSDILRVGEEITVSVDVTNTGVRAGDEVIQMYVRYPHSAVERPRLELKGFARVHIGAGETRTVDIPLRANELRYWNEELEEWTLETTPVEILVGASSEDVRLVKMIDVAE